MPDTDGPTIRVSKDGPYLVDGRLPIAKQTIVVDDAQESVAWRESERDEGRGSCALCRCGSSGVKPYCDGTHRTAGFDGTETADTTPYLEAATDCGGETLRLLDEMSLCAEARFCSAKGAIWHRIAQDDEDSRTVVIEQANLCPSGRYTAVDRTTGARYEPELERSIGIVEDPSAGVSGPLWIRGGVQVVSADGEPYEVRNRVTLCRCGDSKNKPFCDGSHVETGFDDTSE
jgi:CDGSH-type Zn-finger protein